MPVSIRAAQLCGALPWHLAALGWGDQGDAKMYMMQASQYRGTWSACQNEWRGSQWQSPPDCLIQGCPIFLDNSGVVGLPFSANYSLAQSSRLSSLAASEIIYPILAFCHGQDRRQVKRHVVQNPVAFWHGKQTRLVKKLNIQKTR